MTRLQKKCFVVSSGAHGLLLLIFFVAAAFRSEPSVSEDQVLTIVSPRILDVAGSGGEPPAPAAAAPQPPSPPSRPAASDPLPPLRTTPPLKAAEHMAPSVRLNSPAAEKPVASAKPAPKTHEIIPDLSRTTRITPAPRSSESPANSARAATDSRSEEVARSFADLASNVRATGARATVVSLPGQGGGESFVGYETAIYNAYYHAWKAPEDSTDMLAAAFVKIVVERDGTINAAEIVTPSGNPSIDRSVQRALDQVKKLPPFPETSQDAQRSFVIRFRLKETL